MQGSWTNGQLLSDATESVLSMLISLFVCLDCKLPVISLAWLMCPPLSQKGEWYFDGPVPQDCLQLGEGSSPRKTKDSFQEKQTLSWNEQQMFTV